jgi:hypothetical protein
LQVETIAIAGAEALNLVSAGAGGEHVTIGTAAARQGVVALVAPDGVVAGAGGDGIIALAAEDQVRTIAGIDDVIILIAVEDVVAGAADYDVLTGAAADGVSTAIDPARRSYARYGWGFATCRAVKANPENRTAPVIFLQPCVRERHPDRVDRQASRLFVAGDLRQGVSGSVQDLTD